MRRHRKLVPPLVAAALLGPSAALAQPNFGDIIPNFAGVGLGFAPAYQGSRETVFGAAPGGRIGLGGERFIALTGPAAEMNLLDHRHLQFGPVLNYRFGRSDADDLAVRALGDRNASLEAGGRIGVSYLGLGSIPFRLRAGVSVMGDVTGQYGGLSIIPSASVWVPLSPQVFVGAGALARFASASQNRYFFGVSQAGSAASGLPVFTPGSGAATVTAWPAMVWRLNANWAVGGGLAYTRIMGDAADSPIVQRGSRDQLIGGIGLAYTW
jgi:MipA family protein